MMRFMSIGVLFVMLFASACAALKKTEDLPSPTRGIQGGPEGEEDPIE
jgi:hypothetical protein